MPLHTSSYFAGVATVVVTMALGFGGGVLLTDAFVGKSETPPGFESPKQLRPLFPLCKHDGVGGWHAVDDGVRPGRFRGTIDISVPGSQVSHLSVPVTLNIQTGPIWVIVALAVGIGTAQLLQWWEQTGSKRRELFRRLDDVESERST